MAHAAQVAAGSGRCRHTRHREHCTGFCAGAGGASGALHRKQRASRRAYANQHMHLAPVTALVLLLAIACWSAATMPSLAAAARPVEYPSEAEQPPPAASSVMPPSCSDGTYRIVTGPWLEGCPGFARCEPGFWCTGGVKRPCLDGHYGDAAGQVEATCSGPCAAGHMCVQHFDTLTQLLTGSTSPTQHECGGPDVYCPAGSGAVTEVRQGYYTVDEQDRTGDGSNPRANMTRSGERKCEIGHYCSGGLKYQCPAGRFGDTEGQSSPQCSGECEEGYYCPSGSIRARQVTCEHDPGVFCPAGSGAPLPLFDGQDTLTGGVGAYYAVPSPADVTADDPLAGAVAQNVCPMGHYCQEGKKFACPPGRYGSTKGITTPLCSGVCEAGYYCPAGSVSPREHRCGGNDVFCPPGSFEPTLVAPDSYGIGGSVTTRTGQRQCQPGSYCLNGQRFECPEGRYGVREGETDPGCSGPCDAGYFCEAGSPNPKQYECGSPDVYCPEGSSEPHPVFTGYYTVRVVPDATVETTTGEAFSHPQSMSQFQPDALNVYPPDTTVGSASAVASTILSEIRLDTSAIRTHERMCEEGFFCFNGQRFECPAGRFGNERMLSDDLCSGNCTAGYYCPPASTRTDQVQCGSNSVYCPEASVDPTPVTPGYYTVGGDPETRDSEVVCAPGTWCSGGVWTFCGAGSYGATQGLMTPDCTGVCEAGYYCPTGSTDPKQIACGDETVFCPKGSAAPVPVGEGFYTAGGRNERIPAVAGMYCRATYGVLDSAQALVAPIDVEFDAARFCTGGQIGDNNTRSTQIACEPGHFCIAGLRYECPPAHYGSAPSLTNPKCTGRCKAGWYCPWASTSPFEKPCGGSHVYCPELSGAPTPVSTGHYTLTDRSPAIRILQTACEPGFYCIAGLKYPCPSRRYGSTYGLTNALCSGVCAAGHYCPQASVSPLQRECGGSDVYCPVGSEVPLKVAKGFYTTGGFEQTLGRPENTTRSWQEICEPGHYCAGGIKRQCPSRVYGIVSGLSTAVCSGVCPEGHFCPPGTVDPFTHTCGSLFLNTTDDSFLVDGDAINGGFAGAGAVAGEQAGDNPLYIAWEDGVRVRRPTAVRTIESIVSIHSFEVVGGVSSVYCPEGSDFPVAVTSGYYSIGGGSDNTTRVAQLPCEPGWFCVAGRKYPCPAGTFGNAKKLTSRYCSGWCPAGFFCPLAAPEPVECTSNTYSTGGSPLCLECPTEQLPPIEGASHIQVRCRNSRLCCNY